MTIKYCLKTHSLVVNDSVNTYYSDPELNAALGTAEKFLVEVRTSNVSGTTPKIAVTIETSVDGVNWAARSTPIPASLTLGVPGPTVQYGSDLGTSVVAGRFIRVGTILSGASASAFVEIWVCGRSAV